MMPVPQMRPGNAEERKQAVPAVAGRPAASGPLAGPPYGPAPGLPPLHAGLWSLPLHPQPTLATQMSLVSLLTS